MIAAHEDIIRDLLRNEPAGDYTPQQLFTLNLHSRWCCETAIYNMYYAELFQYSFQVKGPARGVLTRRSNRLWGRLSKAVDDVRVLGGPGVYRVWIGIDTVGYVWAADLEQSQRLADTMYGYLAAALGAREVKITYVRYCAEEVSARVLEGLNEELCTRAKREVEEAKRSMALAEKKMAQALAVLELVVPCKTDGGVV